MKKILIIAFCFLMNFALLALSPETKYNDAHTAFKTNDFQKAANLYRQMVDEDSIVSADVYYNLANAYYRLNDFPSAILFYHKTLKLDADYVDAAYNLRLAERNLEDKIEPVPQLFYIRWYRSLCASLSTDSWAWMFCITFFVAIICLIFFAKSKKSELRKVFFEDVVDGGLFALERHAVRDRDGKRHRFGSGGILSGLVLNDGDKAVVLTDDHAGDFKKLVGAARRTDRLGECGETRVVRIKGDVKQRADVGALIALGETTLSRTAKTRTVLTTRTARAAAEFATSGSAAGSITAWAAGIERTLARSARCRCGGGGVGTSGGD
jgi:hypothetical protein